MSDRDGRVLAAGGADRPRRAPRCRLDSSRVETDAGGNWRDPVYIPTGEVRELRALLSQRDAVVRDRTTWLVRAKMLLLAAGSPARPTPGSHCWLENALAHPDGVDALTADRVEQCQRIHLTLTDELKRVDARIHALAQSNDAIRRMQTVPAVGERVAVTLFAWIGNVRRCSRPRTWGIELGRWGAEKTWSQHRGERC